MAGRADILLVPNIEAGNMLAKQLQYFAGADSAGIVLGARVPVVLTSRADNVRMRIGSAAVAKLLAHGKRAAAVRRWPCDATARAVRAGPERGLVEHQVLHVPTQRRTALERELRGQVSEAGRGRAALARARDGRSSPTARSARGPLRHADALASLLEFLRGELAGAAIAGVGHRVVHGGLEFMAPTRRGRRRRWRGSSATCRSRRCTSRTTSRPSA